MIRWWTMGDDEAITLLRRLARGDTTAAATAEALFSLDPDLEGEILADALHVAAEFTSDGDVESAVGPWSEILRTATGGEFFTSATAHTEVDGISVGRPRNVTVEVKVPA